MADRLRFRETGPHEALRPWIRSYYLLASPPNSRGTSEGLLVPDGHLELGLNLGGKRFDRTRGRWWERGRRCVDEVLERARPIRWEGPIRYIGVKFRYAAGFELLNLAVADVGRDPLKLEELSLSGLAELEDTLQSDASWPETTRAINRFFLGRLRDASPNPLVAAASSMFRASGGSLPISSVAESLGVSRRTLELRVKERTGLTPKRLSQIVRTREAIRRIRRAPDQCSGRTAIELGYCDQSHFIREFKGLVGRTPTAFFGMPQFVSDFCDRTGAAAA